MLRAPSSVHGRPGGGAPLRAVAGCVLVLLVLGVQLALGAPAQASLLTEPDRAAQAAQAQGFRTGIAVLDLTTDTYRGSGDDSGLFASESVVKVLIATRLLLDGHLVGPVRDTAYRMITASDDEAATQLYEFAGGDGVLPSVAAHYGIAGLGAPPSIPGHWGMTQVSAEGLVRLYAALVQDPLVWPWLGDAMAHVAATAADGTSQRFGLAAAVPGSAVKQGWGHDSLDRTGKAITNTTGVAYGGKLAVAVLTEGPAGSYGAAIQAVVTAETQVLLSPNAPATAAPEPPSPAAVAATPVAGTPAASSSPVPATLAVSLAVVAAGATCALLRRLWRRLVEALSRRRAAKVLRRHQRSRRAAALRTGRTSSSIVRLPDGRLVRVSATPRARTAHPPRPAASVRPRVPVPA